MIDTERLFFVLIGRLIVELLPWSVHTGFKQFRDTYPCGHMGFFSLWHHRALASLVAPFLANASLTTARTHIVSQLPPSPSNSLIESNTDSHELISCLVHCYYNILPLVTQCQLRIPFWGFGFPRPRSPASVPIMGGGGLSSPYSMFGSVCA